MSVRFVLNGKAVSVAQEDPHGSLLTWLRGAGYTGAKEGCAEGECGACAVALLAEAGSQQRYEAVNSCLIPLAAVDGKQLITVEGVAARDGTLHPVQAALVERGGSQCGYCTPGFVISLFCEYYRPDRQDYDPESVSGNLCRCTGYRPICEAARSLGKPAAADPHLVPLRSPAERARPLDVHARDRRFTRPTSLPELYTAWGATPEATLIAGGTDLMVYANQRDERWPALIALDAIAELARCERTARGLALGAGVTLAALQRFLHEQGLADTALGQLLPRFASPLIRRRATVGGNLATASPIGDLAPALLALEAEVVLGSAAGERRVALADFFVGYRKTELRLGELITRVHVPWPMASEQRFYKVGKRNLDDISSVAAAFALELDSAGTVVKLRAAYGGVSAIPLRATALEQVAQGKPWNHDTVRALAPLLDTLGSPIGDHRASAAYRKAMIRRLFERFFHETTNGGTP